MLTSLQIYWAVVLVIAWSCGFTLNASILATYLINKKKEKSLGVCDKIILIMACCNVLLQSLLAFDMTCFTYGLYILFAAEFSVAITIILFFSIHFSFWLMACLSVYYCLRLVPFSCPILIHLQRRISVVVTLFLLVSALISWLINILFIWTVDIDTEANTTSIYQDDVFHYDRRYMAFNIIFGSALPFVVTFLCMGLCLISLLRHIQRMKRQVTQFWCPQLKCHVKAFRTMLLLLILNLLFFTTFGIVYLSQHNLSNILKTVLWAGTMLIPSGQALILIFGNSKLASAWPKTFPVFGLRARNE